MEIGTIVALAMTGVAFAFIVFASVRSHRNAARAAQSENAAEADKN